MSLIQSMSSFKSLFLLLLFVSSSASLFAQQNQAQHPASLSETGVYFEANAQQYAQKWQGAFRAVNANYEMQILADKLSIGLVDTAKNQAFVWNIQVLGVNKNAQIVGKLPQKAAFKQIISAQEKAKDIATYKEVWYKNVYPRIDMRVYGKEGGDIEYDYVLENPQDYTAIKMQLQGIEQVKIAENGELLLANVKSE
jgi:hypothetical protein